MTAAYDGGLLRSPGDRRSLPVPDGLDGMPLDQAGSRPFGRSRPAAATAATSCYAPIDGLPPPKSA